MINFIANLTQEDRRKFYLSCIGFMCVSSAALITRTVGDTLFLNHHGFESLSYMYLGTAVIVGGAAYGFGVFISRMPLSKLTIYIAFLLTSLVCILWLLLNFFSWKEFSIAAYFTGDIIAYLPMLLFWNFITLLFNPREAKRLFGYIGASGAIACILAGYVVRFIAPYIGSQNFLFLVMLILIGFIRIIYLLSTSGTSISASAVSRSPLMTRNVKPDYFISMFRNHQIRNLALLVFTGTIAVVLTDFQFKAAARIHYQGSELAGFFGAFYGTGNMVALLIQMFLVYHIFQYGGLLLALRILPAGLLIISIASVVTGSFASAVVARFLVQIFSFTIDMTALQLLYIGVNKRSRSQTRAFIDGIIKPSGIAISGLTLICATPMIPLNWLAGGCMIATLFWFILTKYNHTAYVSSLTESLSARRIDMSHETFALYDKTYVTQLRNILFTSQEEDLPYLVNLTSELPQIDWSPEFLNLLHRDSAASKITAIQYFKEKGKTKYLAEILKYIQHPDAHVRTEVIKASTILDSYAVLKNIGQYIEDTDLSVREIVIIGLINSSDNNNRIKAQKVHASWIDSVEPELRCTAARILRHLKHGEIIQPLLSLLNDENHSVTIEAIRTCRYHYNEAFIPILVRLMDNSLLRRETIETLVHYGKNATNHLIAILNSSLQSPIPASMYQIPGILTRISNPQAIPALLTLSASSDQKLRSAAIEGFCALISKYGLNKRYLSSIDNILQREINENLKLIEPHRMVQRLAHGEILHQALHEEYNYHIKNILNLLNLQYSSANLKTLFTILTGSDLEKRANALEILDNVLEGKNRTIIMHMLETEKKEPSILSAGEIIEYLIESESLNSDWTSAGILYAVGKNKLHSFTQLVIDGLNHHNYVLRETALFSLKEMALHNDKVMRTIGNLLTDAHPSVRKLADEYLNS